MVDTDAPAFQSDPSSSELWRTLNVVGVLNDRSLARLISEGKVVSVIRGFESGAVSQSCIELTVSDRSYGLAQGELALKDTLTLGPNETVSFVTNERLHLPLDCCGRVYPKVKMTTIGLLMASTFVDPGFDGPLILTVHNTNDVPIRLPQRQAIAKLELEKLPEANLRPYKGGFNSIGASIPFDQEFFRQAAEEIQRAKEYDDAEEAKRARYAFRGMALWSIIAVALLCGSIGFAYWLMTTLERKDAVPLVVGAATLVVTGLATVLRNAQMSYQQWRQSSRSLQATTKT